MRIIGMMSGTSVDGIDVAIADINVTDMITTFDAEVAINQLAFTTIPWDEAVRRQIFALFHGSTSAAALCQANFMVAEQFADAAHRAVQQTNIDWESKQPPA